MIYLKIAWSSYLLTFFSWVFCTRAVMYFFYCFLEFYNCVFSVDFLKIDHPQNDFGDF